MPEYPFQNRPVDKCIVRRMERHSNEKENALMNYMQGRIRVATALRDGAHQTLSITVMRVPSNALQLLVLTSFWSQSNGNVSNIDVTLNQ